MNLSDEEYRTLSILDSYCKGSTSQPVVAYKVADIMGIPQQQFINTISELDKKGLVVMNDRYAVWFTQRGIDTIRKPVGTPEQSSQYTTNIHGHNFGGLQQGGQQNAQNIQVNINPEFNENLSKLIALIKESSLTEVQKEETIEDLERVGKLAQREKTPDVLEAAKKRLDLVKTSIDIATNIGPTAMTYLLYAGLTGAVFSCQKLTVIFVIFKIN
jgi:hypothetical protein